MPRDVSGVYDVPPGTEAVTNTTITSTAYNAFLADLVNDLNAARPITAGGTGGDTAIEGFDGLSAAGADIASAATLNLDNATGPVIDVTGTTTITAVTLTAGRTRLVRFTSSIQITCGASLIGPASGAVVRVAPFETVLFRGFSGAVVQFWVIPRAGPIRVAEGGPTAPGMHGTYNNAADTDTGWYEYSDGGDKTTGLAIDGTPFIEATPGGTIVGRSTSDDVIIDGQLRVLASTGPVILGDGQVTFPATQNPSVDPNTLDDYEEGTTTPTPTAGSGTFTSVSATLRYTKIGDLVTWNAAIAITTNGTAATNIIIPMPFTCGAQKAAVAGLRTDNGTAVAGRINASASAAVIFLYDGTYPGATGAAITAGGAFSVSS